DGLEDGLYHFAVHRRCLYPVRLQELSHYIARVIQPTGEKAPILTFFLTVIFFRSAWKYRDRSYRYHLLDTGHLAENLVLALKSLRLPFCLSYNFDDRRVNHLLGLDETKEVALSVAQVPGNKTVSAEGDQEEIGLLPEKMRRSSHVSGHEIDYPSIGEIHRSGALVISYTGPKLEMCKELGLKPETWTNITRPTVLSGDMKYPDALFKRRSRRNFIKEPLLKECMAVLLDSLCIKDYAHSTGETEYFTSVCTGFFADHVEGMAPGLYLLDSSGRSTGLVVEGHFLDRMARICLDQAWLVNAAAHFLFLTNLDLLDSLFGARGYRYAMMSAGRMGERLYLTATAMGLGCCGIGAFYDREAAELIGLNNGSRLLYLVALGPVKGPLIS
ncbi:MAG: SagB/ThcOx family dehydrogenase, partial [Thermodesulfobacteriota bacterium]|nr:SagB/ThcOx family dehydrogenase [Thermodesulfobacteriota bacterium]